MLEERNSSMTTATESMDMQNVTRQLTANNKAANEEDEMKMVETTVQNTRSAMGIQQNEKNELAIQENALANVINENLEEEATGGMFSMADTMDRQLLKNIEQYVLQNMSRGQINLEEMSRAMGMGRVPFFHKVRNLTNKTPAELVRDLRLKHACILLKRTNINMSELAVNVGFMTAENFIKVFKEKFGLSPLEYRLKHRK